MQITFLGFSQPVKTFISGPSNLDAILVRFLVSQCEQGLITAPQLTFIVEGTTRLDAVFSTP